MLLRLTLEYVNILGNKTVGRRESEDEPYILIFQILNNSQV